MTFRRGGCHSRADAAEGRGLSVDRRKGQMLVWMCLLLVVSAGSSVSSEERTSDAVAAAKGMSRGVDSLIAEIRKREFTLQKRGLELEQREKAVMKLEAVVEARVAELEVVREEIERRITSWTNLENDRIVQLSKVYSAMPPNKAANLVGKIELDLSVAIVRKMKKKQSAALLAAMRTEKALTISNRLLDPLNPATDEK